MSWTGSERLYDLLPAVHRIRDAKGGEALRALLSILESEVEVLEADIEGLYENAFIETCADWVIPYIGDLLGARHLHAIDDVFSPRAYVANTIRYRRRKGTASVLEQLALDVTGWPARVVEFFQILGTTQHLNHLRLDHHRTPDLRAVDALQLLSTPFQSASRTAEVRRIPTRRGRYNIPNIGLFLWRLADYPLEKVTPRAPAGAPSGGLTFSPLGLDTPLFNRRRTETDIEHLAEESDVPAPLRRLALYNELDALRTALVDGGDSDPAYFGDVPVLAVYDENDEALAPQEIAICTLEGWDAAGWTPPESAEHACGDETYRTRVAVDPLLGRLIPIDGETVPSAVSYAYGFSGDLGGGPYSRRADLEERFDREITWQVAVGVDPDANPGDVVETLTEAVDLWNAQPAGTVGLITVMDSRTYAESLTGASAIVIPERSRLAVIAGAWPKQVALDGTATRSTGRWTAEGPRPHLLGDISVVGRPDDETEPGELILSGLLIEGWVTVRVGNLGGLAISHCTVVAAAGGVTVNPSVDEEAQNMRLAVEIHRAIVGPVSLPAQVPKLVVEDSVVEAGEDAAIGAPGSDVRIETSTIFGTTAVKRLEASESIFTGRVTSERRQEGCARYSYVPEGSRTPRRYACQPDGVIEAADEGDGTREARRVTPLFTSRDFAHPAYGQLAQRCAEEIREGGADDTEMGAFHFLGQPQRLTNLDAVLEEYLRFGLEAGVFLET